MTCHSLPPSLPRAFRRALAATTLALAALSSPVAAAAAPQRAGARSAAACVTAMAHTGHGSRSCALGKVKHRNKRKPNRSHHSKRADKHGADTGSGIEAGTGASSPRPTIEASCSDGSDATVAGNGSFVCANGSEPGCGEGFAPVVSSDASTMLCEREAGSGEEPETAEPEEAGEVS